MGEKKLFRTSKNAIQYWILGESFGIGIVFLCSFLNIHNELMSVIGK